MQNQESAIQCFKWAEANYEMGCMPLSLFLFRKAISHLLLADVALDECFRVAFPHMSEECIHALEVYNDTVSNDPVEYMKWADSVSCLFHM